MKNLKCELERELPRVLAFWKEHAFNPEDGSFLTLGCDNRPLPDGRRSSVLQSRILWAYSAAFCETKNKEYLEIADRAFVYLKEKFLDPVYGGVYELLDSSGDPTDRSKVIYTQSYAVYGCAAYYLAGGNREALEAAKTIYEKIESEAFDGQTGGYLPVLGREWDRTAPNDRMIMDTHLHLTESYALLHEAWPDERLRQSLKRVTEILLNRYLRPHGALYQVLDNRWQETEDTSDRFGDEAECAWMICKAAERVCEPELTKRVHQASVLMMENLLRNGYDTVHGGVFDRKNSDGSMSTDKLWWEESESVIGLLYAWEVSKKAEFAEKALETWEFIRKYILNPENEWNWKVRADGTFVNITDPSDPLKCPYHSARICILAGQLLKRNGI